MQREAISLLRGRPNRTFQKTIVNTARSNPTDSIFFRASVPGFEDCATFHGDYNNVSLWERRCRQPDLDGHEHLRARRERIRAVHLLRAQIAANVGVRSSLNHRSKT